MNHSNFDFFLIGVASREYYGYAEYFGDFSEVI